MRKPFKVVSVIVSILTLLGSLVLITVLVLSDLKVFKLSTNEPRYYNGSFYNEGVLLYETGPLKRGELINYNEAPDKDREADGTIYQFIGWDLDGNKIPDILGDRIYFNFKANAVFMKLPIPSEFTMTEEQMKLLLNLLENLNVKLTPEQIKKLMEILQNLNIDWTSIDKSVLEQLLNFLGMDIVELMELLGLSFDDLMALINAPVFSYKASNTDFPVFFRTQSYGDYYDNGKWKKGDYYSRDKVSPGSANPLCYTMDKLSRSVTPIDYTMTYFKNGRAYPVPQYELANAQWLNSESHSLENPAKSPTEEFPSASTYSTTGYGFFPASAYTVPILQNIKYSNPAIERDELAYRQYAREHYLNIEEKYATYLRQFAALRGIQFDEYYTFVGRINEVFKEYRLYELNPDEMTSYPKGVDKITYFLEEAKAGLSENFAAATTLLYRALGVPARYVTGYWDYNLEGLPGEDRVVGGLQTHAWTEIYIDGIGWMMVDTSISNSLPPEYAKYLFGSPDIDFDNYDKRTLISIDVENEKTRYFTGQQFDKKKLKITANYDNGTTSNIDPTISSDPNNFQALWYSEPDMYTPGTKTLKIIYSENGIPASKKIQFEVVDPVVISMTINPNSYQNTYLVGNRFNADRISATLEYDDGSKDTIFRDQLIFDDPSIDVAGEYDIPVKWSLNEEIQASFHITVLEEPTARLATLENNRTTPYSHFIRSESFNLSTLDLKAIYEDGTYRNINEDTGTFSYEGDLSKLGLTTITVYYTERGVGRSIDVQVMVRNLSEDAYFKVDNAKEYDGQNYDIASTITIMDEDVEVLSEGDHIEIKIMRAGEGFDKDNFKNAGERYKVSYRIKIVNSNGADITDEYINELKEIEVRYTDGTSSVTYPIDKFVKDDEGFMTFPSNFFSISKRAIQISTIDALTDETNYYDTDGNLIDPLSMYNLNYTGETEGLEPLAEGHYIDPASIVFDAVLGDDQYVDNSIDLSQLRIYDADGSDVTNNYEIAYSWGRLGRL